MHRSQSRILTSICIASLLSSGCSWAFVRGAPHNHATIDSFDCTESPAPAIVDSVFTTLFVAYGAGAAAQAANAGTCDRDGEEYACDFGLSRLVAQVSLTIAAVFASAAITGFYRTSNCRTALDDRYARGPIGWSDPS